MTGSLTANKLDASSLLRLLDTQVVVRYSVRRPHRDCNFQDFYAEILDLWRAKKQDLCVLQHFFLNIEVAHFVKDRHPFWEMPQPISFEGVQLKLAEIVTAWEERPGPWRDDEVFSGLLYIGENRQNFPSASFLFSFYHGLIEAKLSAWQQYAYNGMRSDKWPDCCYHAASQLHGRFSSFAARSYITRVVSALSDGF